MMETKEKLKLDQIRDKTRSIERGHTLVSLSEINTLLKAGASYKEDEINKEVGNCYCHLLKYNGRVFFDVTGCEVVNHKRKNILIGKTHYTK